MKLHEPLGKPEYAQIALRIPIALYFILQGLTKLNNVQVFIDLVKSYQLFHDNLATLLGVLIPYLEVGSGILLFLGLWTTLSSILCSLLLIGFIYAIGLHPQAGSDLFNKDLIILGGTLSLIFSGPGAFSIDGFRKN